ncbi:hypothetical protein D3C85_1122500 [compost metagenome]
MLVATSFVNKLESFELYICKCCGTFLWLMKQKQLLKYFQGLSGKITAICPGDLNCSKCFVIGKPNWIIKIDPIHIRIADVDLRVYKNIQCTVGQQVIKTWSQIPVGAVSGQYVI